MSDWQPIETAPTDGTIIDLWVGDHRVPDAYWSFSTNLQTGERVPTAYDCWAKAGQSAGMGGAYPASVGGEPTHWMPRPAAPT